MAPLLVSPPLMDIRNNNKRSHSDIVCTMSMPTMRMGMFTSMGTSKSNNNKLLRNVSWDIQLSKTSESATKKQKHDHHNHDDDEKKDDDDNSAKDGSMMKNQDEIWYSKEEYKQILIEQSLTVRIMRSLRAILASANTSASAETPTNLPNDENTNSNVNADNISNNNTALIKKANLLIDPERYCERGLEAYQSKERRNTINTNRKLHMSLVIGEQSRQRRQQQHQSSTMMMMTNNNNGCGGDNSNTNRKCNDNDPELIRNISMIQSKHSSLKAQLLAAIDQHEQVVEQVVQESNKPTGTGILQKIQEHNHHDDNNKVIPHPVLSGSSIININERRNLYNQGVAAIANNNKSDNGYYFCVAPTPTHCITTSLDTAAAFDTKQCDE